MARRKPKGILDNIADYAKSVTDIWKEGPKDTVQLAKMKQATRNVVQTGATAADAYLTAGLGGSFARNVAIPGSMVASPATKARAVDAGLARFARDAAIVGASAGAIRGTAAGVQAVQAGRVVNPVAAASNVIRGQKVIVHGTPGTIKGNYILPKAGSPGSPKEAVVFGWNPRHPGSKQFVPPSAREYTRKTGSAIVAKVPKSSLKKIHPEGSSILLKQTPWIVSKSPARVVAQIPANSPNYESELAKALKRVGAPLRGPKNNPIKEFQRKMKYRSANKRSVV